MQGKPTPATTTGTTRSDGDPVRIRPTSQTVPVVPAVPRDHRPPQASDEDGKDEAGYGYGV
jgi:hypothetical protein